MLGFTGGVGGLTNGVDGLAADPLGALLAMATRVLYLLDFVPRM